MSTTPKTPGTERPSSSARHASARARPRLIRRGDRPAQSRRPGPAMSEDLGPVCAEFAALIPALIPALSRDGIPPAAAPPCQPAAPSTPTSCTP
jgi:hypothetical protein